MIAVALVGLALFLITPPVHGSPELEPNLLSLQPDRGAAPACRRLCRRAIARHRLASPARPTRHHGRTARRHRFYGGYILGIDPYLPHHDLDRSR